MVSINWRIRDKRIYLSLSICISLSPLYVIQDTTVISSYGMYVFFFRKKKCFFILIFDDCIKLNHIFYVEFYRFHAKRLSVFVNFGFFGGPWMIKALFSLKLVWASSHTNAMIYGWNNVFRIEWFDWFQCYIDLLNLSRFIWNNWVKRLKKK